MPFYLFEDEFGAAIVSAANQDEALQQLETTEDFEHNGKWLALRAKAGDFKLLSPLKKGVLFYHRKE